MISRESLNIDLIWLTHHKAVTVDFPRNQSTNYKAAKMHHVNFNSLQLTKQTILLGNNDKNDNKPLLFGRRSFEIITVACAFKRHFLTEQDQTSPVICHSIGLIGVFRRPREFKRSRFFLLSIICLPILFFWTTKCLKLHSLWINSYLGLIKYHACLRYCTG